MLARKVRPARSEKLDLRLTPQAKQTLVAAAASAHRSVSEFVLEGALKHAEETLADRRTFLLADAEWEEFVALLDAPPRVIPELSELLARPAPWED
jgi:uncharacterized protein (DUF1778 family)